MTSSWNKDYTLFLKYLCTYLVMLAFMWAFFSLMRLRNSAFPVLETHPTMDLDVHTFLPLFIRSREWMAFPQELIPLLSASDTYLQKVKLCLVRGNFCLSFIHTHTSTFSPGINFHWKWRHFSTHLGSIFTSFTGSDDYTLNTNRVHFTGWRIFTL